MKWHILDLLQCAEITVYGKSLDFFFFSLSEAQLSNYRSSPGMRNNSYFLLLFIECVGVRGKLRKHGGRRGGGVKLLNEVFFSTNLWTLPHLLTFSYDVVSHDNKRWVSLRCRIKRRHLFHFFFSFLSKNAITPWNDTLTDAVAVMQRGKVYCRQAVESPRDLLRTPFKKTIKDYVHKQSHCFARC